MLESLQRTATALIRQLGDLRYGECVIQCGITIIETYRLRGDQM